MNNSNALGTYQVTIEMQIVHTFALPLCMFLYSVAVVESIYI